MPHSKDVKLLFLKLLKDLVETVVALKGWKFSWSKKERAWLDTINDKSREGDIYYR